VRNLVPLNSAGHTINIYSLIIANGKVLLGATKGLMNRQCHDMQSESRLTEFYLNIETLGVRPLFDKIIAIQYQKVDTVSGAGKGPLTALKEWESSEREILKEFLEVLNPDDPWDFIPVSFNARFILYFLQSRFRKELKYQLSNEWVYYNLPIIDLKSILVLMNKGQFKGSSVDWLIRRDLETSEVATWYERKEYNRIEEYIAEETKRLLHAYQFLKAELPMLHVKYRPLP
jgi:hypothetical protein